MAVITAVLAGGLGNGVIDPSGAFPGRAGFAQAACSPALLVYNATVHRCLTAIPVLLLLFGCKPVEPITQQEADAGTEILSSPSASEWGRWGFTYQTKEKATEKFQSLATRYDQGQELRDRPLINLKGQTFNYDEP